MIFSYYTYDFFYVNDFMVSDFLMNVCVYVVLFPVCDFGGEWLFALVYSSIRLNIILFKRFWVACVICVYVFCFKKSEEFTIVLMLLLFFLVVGI